MPTPDTPNRCPMCGYYLTTASQFKGQRCTDPSHWLAAGLAASTDYYFLAQVCAQSRVELNQPLRPYP